jgi:hypothetical protein
MNTKVENFAIAVLRRNVLASIRVAQITASKPIRLFARLAIAVLVLNAVTSVCCAQIWNSATHRGENG